MLPDFSLFRYISISAPLAGRFTGSGILDFSICAFSGQFLHEMFTKMLLLRKN
jgi:hypothetical protein